MNCMHCGCHANLCSLGLAHRLGMRLDFLPNSAAESVLITLWVVVAADQAKEDPVGLHPSDHSSEQAFGRALGHESLESSIPCAFSRFALALEVRLKGT